MAAEAMMNNSNSNNNNNIQHPPDRQVILEGGLPWGFRIQGGSDTGFPLRIARVNPGSKSSLQGVREGDVITAINGQPTEKVSNSHAHGLLKEAGPTLTLTLKQGSSLSRRIFKTSSSTDVSQTANQIKGSDHPSAAATTSGISATSGQPATSGSKSGVWSPGYQQQGGGVSDHVTPERDHDSSVGGASGAVLTSAAVTSSAVWTPTNQQPSPTSDRKEFRSVNLHLKKQESAEGKPAVPTSLPPFTWADGNHHVPQQQQQQHVNNSSNYTPSSTPLTTPLTTPQSEYSTLLTPSTNYSVLSWERRGSNQTATPTPTLTTPPTLQTPLQTPTSHLPKVPNPTVTLLQKAREGQLPKGAAYLDAKDGKEEEEQSANAIYRSPYESLYRIEREYCTSDEEKKRRHLLHLTANNKYSGVDQLRSSIRDEDHHQWYRRMYDSLHRNPGPEDYVTVRYKSGRSGSAATGGRPTPSGGGYLSEPERFDYGATETQRYTTLDRRRQQRLSESNGSVNRLNFDSDVHRIQPGRIEDYVPGRSSLVEKQAPPPQVQTPKANAPPKSFTAYALKESGYESDSQLVFRRRAEAEATPTDPHDQRVWYRDIQRGGEVPLHGLRKPQPNKTPVWQDGDGLLDQHASGPVHRFAESEVTINYRRPIRNLQSSNMQQDIDEEDLKQLQAEHMRRVYEQERRRKYLQELEDIESRRHMDNFTPLMKSPIPLNRYDDFLDENSTVSTPQRDRTPEPKIVARGLYNFVAQNNRELSFQKGDVIYVRRQIDKNWYEGEHNAMIGIFPVNYVEIIPYDGIRMTLKKPSEGKGRVKYNFVAQTPVELCLVKGEMVIIMRQVDEHWMEGRIGHRKGIFPISYIDVIQPPGDRQLGSKTIVSPAGMTGGSSPVGTYRSQPQYGSMPKMNVSSSVQLHQYGQQQQQQRPTMLPTKMGPMNVMVETHSEPVLYRALYTYTPQNDDELELQDGDTVCVLEKCDDGWYVGTSQRTGLFGTFPGNYVERL